MLGQNFDFHPEMRSERVAVDIHLFGVEVLEVGNTIVETYCANGMPWIAFVKTFDDPRPLVTYWMSLPGMRDFIAEMLHYGVVPTQTWVNLWTSKFVIADSDGALSTPSDGTKIIARSHAGISCGYGQLEVNGKVRFLPVYGDDPYRPGGEGCLPGEEIHLFIALAGVSSEMRLYSQTPIIWTGNGARIEIPVMTLTPRVAVEKVMSPEEVKEYIAIDPAREPGKRY
ncbi:MAG: hypothetical protein WBP42_02465 [Candidatus Zixiibacteriota bacterium]